MYRCDEKFQFRSETRLKEKVFHQFPFTLGAASGRFAILGGAETE
jgi:hypothetical protein